MKKISIALMVCCMLFGGCATTGHGNKACKALTKNEVYIGVGTIDSEKGVKVVSALTSDPAGKAGLLPGDIIKQINGVDVSNFKQLAAIIRNLKPDTDAKFMVEHNGQVKQLTVNPKQREVPADIDARPVRKVAELLSANSKVSLLIIAGEISNTANGYKENAEWETRTRNELQSSSVSNYLRFLEYPNFRIVESNKTAELLKGIKYSLSGVVSNDFRAQVTKITGANYILYITFARKDAGKNSYNDEITERLISTETGEVVGSDTLHSLMINAAYIHKT